MIDVVTSRTAELHSGIANALDHSEALCWASESKLYAVSYRGAVADGSPRVEVWPYTLAVGKPLPEVPLWLEPDLCLPLALEESYMVTRDSLRIH